jgi:peptidoglycan hydrolase CwlO-like protein
MRLFRALTAALFLVLSLGFVLGDPGRARAQDVDVAERAAEAAEHRANAADSLLAATANLRAGIEGELAASLASLSAINAELSRVSVQLDGLRQHLTQADVEFASVSGDLQVQAVDAYVRAVTLSGTALMGTHDAESAIVAASSLESAIDSDQDRVADLAVKRRELERLRNEYVLQEERVVALQGEADREAAHLEELLAEADASLATAAAEAREADARYRAALDEVDAARAREAERQRESERTTTTTVPAEAPPPTATTTTTVPSTTTPPAATPTTTTLPPVPGGTFPPAVERWRPLVTAYFAADRVDGALEVIRCESYGDANAYNPYSGASGLFQFLPATWATVSPSAGFAGADVFDGEANIGVAAWLTDYYAGLGSDPWAAWTCKP